MRSSSLWFLLIALLLCAGISGVLLAVQPHPSWPGWAGTATVALIGVLGSWFAWRRLGAGSAMAWMIGLAVTLRLAAGIGAYLALPVNGYDEPDDRAGYIFTDAHRRDDQAWALADSPQSIWSAFDKRFYTDQYGGLLTLSAGVYRLFSPDSHRPLIIILVASLAAGLGVPFFLSGARLLWGERLAPTAAWLFVLYPESVITGGAQMREPFLLTLTAVCLFGYARWVVDGSAGSLGWVGLGLAGMLLISPGIAVVTVVLLAIWLALRRGSVRLTWPALVAAACVFVLGLLFFAWSLSGSAAQSGSGLATIAAWSRQAIEWVIFQLERGSGQIQNVFSKLPPAAQFVFVVGYGVTQPVLPPALLEPTTLTWRIIAILRAGGWYLVLPLLAYAVIGVRNLAPGPERRVWGWLTAFTWIWIVVCSIRAGGDQWDNPRYRLIFFTVECLVAARAWFLWRESRDPWFWRMVAAEALSVVVFGQWYLARYYLIGIHLPILVVLSLSIGGVLLIVLGGILWDGYHQSIRGAQ